MLEHLFVGAIKGVGKICMQSVVDANCSLASARLAQSKGPMMAVDTLHDRVLPFYEENGVAVEHILTENGREYRGRKLQQFFDLFPALNQIQHRRTAVRPLEANGFRGRFHRTVKVEFFSVAFRRTLDQSLDQLQGDLDRYLDFHNRERAHQGCRTKGRPPARPSRMVRLCSLSGRQHEVRPGHRNASRCQAISRSVHEADGGHHGGEPAFHGRAFLFPQHLILFCQAELFVPQTS